MDFTLLRIILTLIIIQKIQSLKSLFSTINAQDVILCNLTMQCGIGVSGNLVKVLKYWPNNIGSTKSAHLHDVGVAALKLVELACFG